MTRRRPWKDRPAGLHSGLWKCPLPRGRYPSEACPRCADVGVCKVREHPSGPTAPIPYADRFPGTRRNAWRPHRRPRPRQRMVFSPLQPAARPVDGGARAVYPATVTSHDAPELVHVSGASARLAIGSLLVAGPGASGGGTFRSTGPTSSGYRGEPDSPTSGFR